MGLIKSVRTGLCVVATLFFVFCAAMGTGLAQGPERVVILPFTANAKDDISYLVKGVRDMLATRLAWQDKVAVIEPDLVAPAAKKIPPPYNDEKARKLGKELSAKVVVFGSITVLGTSVSVDARVVKVDDNDPAMSTFVQAASLDQVIPRINDFAQRINADIFKRPEAVAALKKSAEDAKQYAPEQKPYGAPSETAAAEKGAGPLDKLPPNMSPLNPLFYRSLTGVDSDHYWRSPRINQTITSIAVADIDLDGKNELVVLTPDRVLVYRLSGSHFAQIYEMKNGPKGTYLFIDTADIDGDGRPEIFVSNVFNYSIESFVLEWTGAGLRIKAKDIPYYFRVQPKPSGQGHLLLGQEKDLINAFSGPVYEMKYQDKTYVPARELNLPKYATVFNVLLADLNGSGETMTVMVAPGWDLKVFSPSGEELWVSGMPYGASAKYIEQPPASTVDDPDTYTPIPIWLPTRLVMSDLDKDGRPEVVIVRNAERFGGMMERLRSYYQGILFSLYWNGLSMMENWRTPRISGYLTDYTIADVGNVGRPALVMCVSQQIMKGFFSKGTSYVVAFTIKPQKKKKAPENKGL